MLSGYEGANIGNFSVRTAIGPLTGVTRTWYMSIADRPFMLKDGLGGIYASARAFHANNQRRSHLVYGGITT